jgi:hypothetical protein
LLARVLAHLGRLDLIVNPMFDTDFGSQPP